MRHLIIAFVRLFAAPASAHTRDPVGHFFQPKFGDFQAELDATSRQDFSLFLRTRCRLALRRSRMSW